MIQIFHFVRAEHILTRLNIRFTKIGLFVGGVILSHLTFANNISLSTQRIYVDQKHSSTNFDIKNRDSTAQKCDLGITYFEFDENGIMSAYSGVSPPDNAAENVVRFSPKHFVIKPNAKQTVRFRLRRKSDTPVVEHRSYVTLQCKSTQASEKISVNGELASIPLRSQLQQNIPLIVRPRKLDATLKFSDVTLVDNKLSFVLSREGTKSVYGKVTVVNKSNGHILNESANFAIYHETKQKYLQMAVQEKISLDGIVLKFNESEREGDLSAVWSNNIVSL
ncbi:hypothetical protein [Paraglaciecola sp. L1A13]|uniref:hypothetical protein n=1 Tax=Paraglaciecola sp. L1A13 TaxID=2686359 RepID=UPI00131C5773|nr:hypothetical protein [Paraglaciecola sp. L1A13]